MNSGLRRNDVAHPIVLEADYRVGNFIEPRKRLSRLGVAAFALKRKWQSSKRDHKSARFAGELHDIGRRARPGTTTKASADEDHTRVGDSFANFISRFHSCVVTEFGVTACPQTPRHRTAKLHFVRRYGTRR